MGVYIKGMEMPKSCPCELVGVGYDIYCTFVYGVPSRVREYYECCEKETRPSWCPLIGLPPHGRLIDADAWIAKVREELLSPHSKKGTLEIMGAMFRGVIDAPTIIEAETCNETCNKLQDCKQESEDE